MFCKTCGRKVTHSIYSNYCHLHSTAAKTKKKIMENPLKKGINKGTNYLQYLRIAALTNDIYKSDLDREERRGDKNDINSFVTK